VEVTIHPGILKPGKALVRVDLTCNDIYGDAILVMQGRVLAPGEAVPEDRHGAHIDGAGLLIR
jgi:hypothetical protein